MIEICKSKYEAGKWLDDFTKAIIVTIEKMVNALEFKDHMPINLITNALNNVVGKRLEKKAKYFIGKTPFGSRKRYEMTEAIAVIILLLCNIYIYFFFLLLF